MDILIKGIEMPKGNNVLVVDSAGTITKVNRWTGKAEATDPFHVKAIALPEHGRLGDLDLVEEWMRKKHKEHDCPFDIDAFLFSLRKIPTIVEATNGTDN